MNISNGMKKLFSRLLIILFVATTLFPVSVFAATAHSWTERQPEGNADRSWVAIATDATGANLMSWNSTLNFYYISHNSGATWAQLPEFPSTGVSSSNTALASDADGSTLILSTYNQRLYTSSDSGENWTERQPLGDINAGYQDVSSDTDGSTLVATYFDVYVSHDGGVTWDPTFDGVGDFITADTDADGSNLIAGAFSTGLYTSTNGGVDWTPRTPVGGSPSWRSVASDADGSNLIAGSSQRLYTSSNGGVNWTERQPAGNTDVFWGYVDSDATGTHLSANGYTSDDGGVTWVEEPISASFIAVDDDGTNLFAFNSTRLYTSPDNVGPVISSFSPVDDAVEVAAGATFNVTFDEDVATSTGDITLHLVSDDSLVETIDVAGPKVTLSDTDTLTIDPTTTLELGTEYYFLIDVGIVEDTLGNLSTTGISDPTTWSFTTDTLPTVSSFTPLDNATDVALNLLSNGDAYAQFNQNIVAGTGNITVKKSNDDSTVVVLDVTDAGVVDVSGTTLNPYPNVTLEYATEYYVLIDATAIEDENGNAFVGISDKTTWSFTTVSPPTFDFERVSLSDEGVEGDTGSSDVSLSSDGRYVSFGSDATNFVAGDINEVSDIFVYDRNTDTIERVSVADGGVEGDGSSLNSAISDDGRYIVFTSNATNFIIGDTNIESDIFIYDRYANTIERVSVSAGGVEGNNGSSNASISSDGRYVAFGSGASNLTPLDVNAANDIFIRDTTMDTIERLNINPGLLFFNNNSDEVRISGDGMYVVFELFDEDTFFTGLYLYDVAEDTWERIDVNGAEEDGDATVGDFDLSDDGQYVVFSSESTNLTDDVVGGSGAVFLYNRVTDSLEFIKDVSSDSHPTISGDGRFLSYVGPDETEDNSYVYRYDTENNTEVVITENTGIADGGASASYPDISEDGSVIAFTSSNTDLVDDDTNNVDDIFVWQEVVEVVEEPSGGGSSGSRMRAPQTPQTLLEQLQLQLIGLLKQYLALLLAQRS